jgi:hypothetical protein
MTNMNSDQRQNFVDSSVNFPSGIEPDSLANRHLRLQIVIRSSDISAILRFVILSRYHKLTEFYARAHSADSAE